MILEYYLLTTQPDYTTLGRFVFVEHDHKTEKNFRQNPLFYDDKSCGDIACSSEWREDNNDVFFIKLEDAKPEEPIITANNKAKEFQPTIDH